MKVILEKLFLKVIATNLRVRVSCKGVGNGNGEEGIYDSNKKEIEIFVDKARGWVDASNARSIAQGSPNPLFECLVLAHEFGHFLSERSGCRSIDYERLRFVPCQSWPQLSKEEKEVIFAEEMEAWRYAKEILKDLGFVDVHSFDEKNKMHSSNIKDV